VAMPRVDRPPCKENDFKNQFPVSIVLVTNMSLKFKICL